MATLTVSDTTPRVQYTATSSQTVFAYGFAIFEDADLKVYQDTTLLTLTTDYTVSGAGTSAGGNVTLGTGATTGDIITIYRDLAVSRSSDYQTGGDLLAETLNDDLDKVVMMVQQSERDIASRTIRFGQFVTGLPLNEITADATDRANKVIAFNSSGQPIATTEIGTNQGDWATSTAYVTRDIIKDTSNNNIYLCNEAHTSSGSQPISGNTDSGKWDLLVDASSATTSQAAAATSATAAASSATSSASSATTATTKASAASTSATSAASSATSAASSATSAESAAAAVGAKFTFDDSTSMADPGAGDFRFDNATIASVTAVAFDATSADTGNPDISDFIATWDDSTSTINGHLIFKKSGTPATFAIFTVGAVTDNTGWLQVALTHVGSNGSWTAADGAYVQFIRTGDKGDTGSTGSTGATGPRGSDAGLDMVYESTTTDTDQGVGKVWFNHATLSSATILYMDDVDANSANINTLVDSWDDSSTTALRGTIKVTQKADNAIFAIYNVTGAVTSASTYTKIPVTYITGAGSFTDADTSTVWFSRTGDTGAAGSSTPADNTFRIQDNSDATKQIAFEASGITTSTTRTVTMPDSDITLGTPTDNAVTLAKLEDGTQGDILYYGASGAPARLGFGTSGYFLKTQGTGANPVWASLSEYDDSGLQDDIALLGFKVASNGSLAKYNLVDQTVDDFQDTSGVDASASTNETRDASGKYYSGQVAGVAGSSVHTAVGAATWTCPTDVTSADILVVAGGGGGAGSDTTNQSGGGGGGGGIVHHATYTTVPAVVYDLTVGDKGTKGGSVDPRSGTNGGDSSFNDNDEGSQSKMTAVGGGYGGGGGSAVGGDGGSGGGGGHSNAGGSGTQADSSGGTGYGNDGGDGYDGTGAGAGGGAGAVGAAGSSGTGGAGGAGQLFSNFTSYGASGYFGGGGGAGGGTTGGAAGSGGGGAGGTGGAGMTAGTVNTGGGGGGGGDVSTGADGGTGTVIILYTPMAINNMTLVSATTAAQAAPTKGDIVLTYTNGAGSTTLDTDLTAEISADGGSTWTALALTSEGSTGSHNIATSHDVTISSTITSPWNMAYRIKTLNQSASKTTRIQAVSLGWS